MFLNTVTGISNVGVSMRCGLGATYLSRALLEESAPTFGGNNPGTLRAKVVVLTASDVKVRRGLQLKASTCGR